MDEGEIEVDSIRAIRLAEITPALARRSGFKDVVELLKIAKHGRGENIYLIRFHYSPSFLPEKLEGKWAGSELQDRPFCVSMSQRRGAEDAKEAQRTLG